MNKLLNHRISVACLGAIISLLAAFIGGGLTGWTLHVCAYGLRPPEMLGWMGSFVVYGLVALGVVSPALITMCTLPVVKRGFLGKWIIVYTFLAMILGTTAIAMLLVMNSEELSLSSLFVPAATCLGIVVVVSLSMKIKSKMVTLSKMVALKVSN